MVSGICLSKRWMLPLASSMPRSMSKGSIRSFTCGCSPSMIPMVGVRRNPHRNAHRVSWSDANLLSMNSAGDLKVPVCYLRSSTGRWATSRRVSGLLPNLRWKFLPVWPRLSASRSLPMRKRGRRMSLSWSILTCDRGLVRQRLIVQYRVRRFRVKPGMTDGQVGRIVCEHG